MIASVAMSQNWKRKSWHECGDQWVPDHELLHHKDYQQFTRGKPETDPYELIRQSDQWMKERLICNNMYCARSPSLYKTLKSRESSEDKNCILTSVWALKCPNLYARCSFHNIPNK
jgi:hypothetical protein